jgi:hypothetical protein
LLTTTIGLRPSASALPVTNLVCGIGPSAGVDEQDDAVDHREDALDLGAEIGVARRVDDVDPHRLAARGRCPLDRRALGQDGDPALLLEVVRIHRPLLHALVVAEGAGLAEQLVDKGRLAVIDVGDDRGECAIYGYVAPPGAVRLLRSARRLACRAECMSERRLYRRCL